jgi:hypothetical protein
MTGQISDFGTIISAPGFSKVAIRVLDCGADKLDDVRNLAMPRNAQPKPHWDEPFVTDAFRNRRCCLKTMTERRQDASE